jgi:two-component system, NarL family, sensor histidine kinase UhpB
MDPLKILMLEDSPIDAEIIQRNLKLKKPGSVFRVEMEKQGFLQALEEFKPDLVISDNTMPQFSATEALELFTELRIPIPFILITGTVSEEFAAGVIKAGADDYLLKDRLTRLPAAIDAALLKKKNEAEIKREEEMRQLIMRTSLDAIICVDTLGHITVWNARAEELFGWKEAEVIGKPVSHFIITENSGDFLAYIKSNEEYLLNKVIELTMHNRAKTMFPVELAIVRVQAKEANFFCAFIRDITSRKNAEASLKAMEAEIADHKIQEQKKISRALIKGQEAEKNHIGKELHDNISQILATCKMFLSSAAKKNPAIRESIKYPLELINTSIEEIRLLSHKQVTPLKNIHLQEMLGTVMDTLKENIGLTVNFIYEVKEILLSDELKLNIYRIIQEQVNNIMKHAAAKHVLIELKTEKDHIAITVADDGKGFKMGQKRNGIGISNILNRIESYNGDININSSPGKGCKIKILLPS